MTSDSVTAGGIEVGLSHTGKVFYPGGGISKGDLIEYYLRVAGWMLPHLKDRPVIMARYPDGITGPRIIQKNVPDYFPDWVTRVTVQKKEGSLQQVICDKPATLVYLANQACIEMHVFLSRTGRLDRPDQLVVDFDPPAADAFGAARQGALWLRALLADEMGVTSFVKTTGGKGLHVHVPLDRRAGFDEARALATGLAKLLAARHPGTLTTEQRRGGRGDRVYLDVMRNAYAQSVVAPYVVRARPGAAVATPLHWDEVGDKKLGPGAFTLATMDARLDSGDDPWAGLTRRRYGLAGLRRRLELAGQAGNHPDARRRPPACG
jgi:bifunctional non-homologous end joining protein LigD